MPLCHHFACTLKNNDVGYCRMLSGVRESGHLVLSPYFSKCIQNDITTLLFSLDDVHKKTCVYSLPSGQILILGVLQSRT